MIVGAARPRIHKGAQRAEDVTIFDRQISKSVLIEREGVLMRFGGGVELRRTAIDSYGILLLSQRQHDV